MGKDGEDIINVLVVPVWRTSQAPWLHCCCLPSTSTIQKNWNTQSCSKGPHEHHGGQCSSLVHGLRNRLHDDEFFFNCVFGTFEVLVLFWRLHDEQTVDISEKKVFLPQYCGTVKEPWYIYLAILISSSKCNTAWLLNLQRGTISCSLNWQIVILVAKAQFAIFSFCVYAFTSVRHVCTDLAVLCTWGPQRSQISPLHAHVSKWVYFSVNIHILSGVGPGCRTMTTRIPTHALCWCVNC